MYPQTPEWTNHWKSEYVLSLESWSSISNSLLSSEGSDLNTLLREFMLQLCHGHICLVPGCVSMRVFYRNLFWVFSFGCHHLFIILIIVHEKNSWVPATGNHFTVLNCFNLDLYMFQKWDLCNRDTFHHRWMFCYVSWGDSWWPVFREEFAGKVCYRK